MAALRNRGKILAWLALAVSLCAGAAMLHRYWTIWTATDFERARLAYAAGDYDSAHAFAIKSLRNLPGDKPTLRLLARAGLRLDQPESAQAIYSRLDPALMEGEDYYLLAESMLAANEPSSARGLLEKARKTSPRHPETLARLTWLYSALWNDLAAASDCARDLAAIPDHAAEANVMLGILRFKMQDYSAAIAPLRRALASDPTGASFPRFSIVSRSAANQPRPTPRELRKLLARALLHDSQPSQAAAELASLADDAEVLFLKSRALLAMGDIAGAKRCLDRTAAPAAREDAMIAEPSPYAGSAACRECHATIYHRQQESSRHAKTFTPAGDLRGLEPPQEPQPDPSDAEVLHRIAKTDAGIAFRTRLRSSSEDLKILALYALGAGEKGVTLVGKDPKGNPREMRLSYYSRIKGWDRTTGQSEHPESTDLYLGKPLLGDATRRCLNCHTTNARAILENKGAERFDHSIGCERCHGPGANHILAEKAKFPALAIAQPSSATRRQRLELCAQCHSPSGIIEPPDFDPVKPRFIRNQSSTLPRSRCFTQSGDRLDCMTCHDPHKNAETSHAFYEAKCLECHSLASASGSRVAANKVCPKSPKTGCIECHMPKVASDMAHSEFTDHYIRVRND